MRVLHPTPAQPAALHSVGTQLMQHLSQALIAGPSDTIGALKDNMMRIGSVCELRFHFVGLELQNDGSLSQCGIAPNPQFTS